MPENGAIQPERVLTLAVVTSALLLVGLLTGFAEHGAAGSVLGGRADGVTVGGPVHYDLAMSSASMWTWLTLSAALLTGVWALRGLVVWGASREPGR